MKCKQRQPLLIGSIYRPPSSPIDFITKLGDIIDRVSCERKETIVTGDFNCDASGDDSRSTCTSNHVISCFNLFQMLQLIHDPTRVSEFTNSTIDLIFTSHPDLVSESGVLPVLISDHYLIYGVHSWKAPKKEGRSIKLRCIKDIDNDAFRDDLLNAPWEHVINCHYVNDAWSIWHSMSMSIINRHAPMKSKRIRGNELPWLDGEIIQLMRQRDRAHKIAKRSGSQNDWEVYKKLRNSVTEQIRSKKNKHFTSTIEENKGNSSVVWKKT